MAGKNTGRWLIYGANGYTGGLCARESKRRGLSPVLAGRNQPAIDSLGTGLGFETRIVSLDDASALANMLSDIDAVLHCAGPFSATAEPMLAACTEAKTDYLDITGEIDIFEMSQSRDSEWKQAGIISIPGVGFDVVPTDCLAAMLKRALPDATNLRLAFIGEPAKLSPGTAKTAVEGMPRGSRVRRDGKIETVKAGSMTRVVPFDHGKRTCVGIPWGDVATAYWSTGIPNIEVYMGATEKQIGQMQNAARFAWLLGLGPVQRYLKGQIEKRVKGPTETERAKSRTHLWGEVENAAGRTISMTMSTPDGYDVTVDGSLRAVQHVLNGGIAPGAHTPSTAFGADFILELDNIECPGTTGGAMT